MLIAPTKYGRHQENRLRRQRTAPWRYFFGAKSLRLLLLVGIALPMAGTASIYRWVSPNGVVNYGDQPPQNAQKLRAMPPIPPAPPPTPKRSPAPSNSVAHSTAANKAQEATERLNLLTAINNYQNSLKAAQPTRQHVYIPAYIGPYPPYQRWHPHPGAPRPPIRPIRPLPNNRPPTVLLPPPAPASVYSSPVLLP